MAPHPTAPMPMRLESCLDSFSVCFVFVFYLMGMLLSYYWVLVLGVCHGQAWEDEGEQEYEAEAGTGQVSDCKSSVYSGLSKVKCEDEQADYEESVGCL